MPSSLPASRHLFAQSADSAASAAHAAAVLKLLLAQDGSTTRLCEAVAGERVSLVLHQQEEVAALPPALRGVLPGTRFLRRVTSLAARGEVMMDNLSYVALDALPPELARELLEGRTPIGYLFDRLWVRRVFRSGDEGLFEELWNIVGLPDAAASRSYVVVSRDGPCMLIAETYRRAMLGW